MSKKVISLLLAVMLTAAMIVVAAISVSADTDDEGSYVPSEGTETYHIYFYKPDDWENKYTSDAGVYWENGSDTPSACGSFTGISTAFDTAKWRKKPGKSESAV